MPSRANMLRLTGGCKIFRPKAIDLIPDTPTRLRPRLLWWDPVADVPTYRAGPADFHLMIAEALLFVQLVVERGGALAHEDGFCS
jgi:hypothetical protein